MPNWTPQQWDAITDRGHSLIVCAAAGSGKTAVLVERIVRLVLEGCPIERMLVVTFTNAAAGEMRLRIGQALGEAARTEPALAEQGMALSRASISTLHRFCGSLLREHFQALGIDPAFRVGDEQECGVLSRQAMEDALYSCYEVGSEAFLAADRCYTQEELSEMALTVYRFMMTRPDPWAFLERAQEEASADAKTMEAGAAAALLCGDARGRLNRLLRDAEDTLKECREEDGPAHYAAACAQDVALLTDLLAASQQGYGALHAAFEGLAFAALGRKKKGDVFDEEKAARVKAKRDALKKALGALAGAFSLTPEEAAQDQNRTCLPLAGLAELIRTYDALYTAAKRQRGLMDFDDLEHGALRALEQPEVRQDLAGRYRYVFIDEYQDSSAIQEAIIGSFAREDGLFLVGDVKQSIYRFRQAEPALFLEKAARFDREEEKQSRRIDLQRNFRSRANVLEGVNAVFSRIMRADATEIEYDEREKLFCGLPVREDDAPLELHLIYQAEDGARQTPDEEEMEAGGAEEAQEGERELAAVEREAMIAAQRIRELVGTPFYDAKTGEERLLAYRDVAVLMRVARSWAPMAADVLRAQGIPVFCDAGEGYFDIPEVRAMIALLEAIDNGSRDEALLSALRGPALGLDEAQLAQIRIHTPDVKTPYHEAVRRYREEESDALAQKLRAFEARMARWRLCARHQGVDRLIERIYAETGFLAQAGALPGGASRQANLHLLTSRARQFMRAQGGSLHAFLRYAHRLRAGGDSMSASAIGENEDVVRIMTIHKSKGLEFPVVIVLGLGRKISGKPRQERVLLDAELGVGLPCIDMDLGSERDTWLRRAIRIKSGREQLAEEVRILYVAMTRARERLILVGDVGAKAPPEHWMHAQDAAGLLAMHTGLDMVCPTLAAAGAGLNLPEEDIRASESRWRVFAHPEERAAVLSRRTQEDVLRLLARLENAPRDERLEKQLAFRIKSTAAVRKMSVSAILRDEKRAAEDEIHSRDMDMQPLPRFMTQKRLTGAQIGTAFHRMVRMLDLEALRMTRDLGKEIACQVSRMREDGVITAAEAGAVPPAMITRLFASPLGARMLHSACVQREWAFTFRRKTAQGEQLLQGVIDCCFMEKGSWVLVDYKTDSASDVPGAMARHRPQLEIYAEALAEITGIPVAQRVLYLVRAGAGYCV